MQSAATQQLTPLSQEFAMPALSAGRNWDPDKQETEYKNVLELFQHSEISQGVFREFYESLRDSIDPNIKIDDSNILKPFDSLCRKMDDPSINHDPRNVGDVLRVGYTVYDRETLIRAINIIGSHPQCTSFKNEYVLPNSESHFSAFKAHIKIYGPDGRPITCEIQVHHVGMLKANALTSILSRSARSMEKAAIDMADIFRSNDKSYRRHLENLSLARDFVNRIKQLIHDSARVSADLIGLIPSNQRIHYMVDGVDLGTPPKYTKTLITLLPDAFMKRVNKKIPVTSESMVKDFALLDSVPT